MTTKPGEAVYVDDIPSPPGCLHGAFVYSKKPTGPVWVGFEARAIRIRSKELPW